MRRKHQTVSFLFSSSSRVVITLPCSFLNLRIIEINSISFACVRMLTKLWNFGGTKKGKICIHPVSKISSFQRSLIFSRKWSLTTNIEHGYSIIARFTKLIDRTSKLSRASMDLPKIARLIYSLFVFIFRPILWNGWIWDWKIFKRNFELEPQRELQHIPYTNCVIFLLFNAYIYFYRTIPPNTVNFNPNVWIND